MALKKKGSVEDRESGVALCHGMALKKKGSVGDRESGVALCDKAALKKRREGEIGRGPREQYRLLPQGGVKKVKGEKKMIGPGPRERCIAIPLIRYK